MRALKRLLLFLTLLYQIGILACASAQLYRYVFSRDKIITLKLSLCFCFLYETFNSRYSLRFRVYFWCITRHSGRVSTKPRPAVPVTKTGQRFSLGNSKTGARPSDFSGVTTEETYRTHALREEGRRERFVDVYVGREHAARVCVCGGSGYRRGCRQLLGKEG